jgi:hypothetical protein
LIGGPLGAWTYQTLLGIHLVDPEYDANELPTKVALKNGGIEERQPLSEA